MFYIDKITGQVSLNRGDTATITLTINQGSNLNPLQYKLNENDNIYFAIEEPNQPFENAIVKKVINRNNNLIDKNGNITFNIESNDTVLLMPGLYYYEIKAKLYRGNYYTNGSITIIFNEKELKYSIIDYNSNCEKLLSCGNYNFNNNQYYFYDELNDTDFYAEKNNNYLTFNNSSDYEFDNLTYKQEEDKVNTIIQQTKWTVER